MDDGRELGDVVVAGLAAVVTASGGERRQGQDEMARAVAEAIEDERHLLVQAGTGTGKSWGYLVPAVTAAVRSSTTVVVATSTLALQAQLVRHDLPRLAEALTPVLGRRPTWQVVKGRHNYVCVHRLGGGLEPDEEALSLWGGDTGREPGPRTPVEQQVARVREWAEGTGTGERDDLVPGVSERAWRAVAVTARECIGAQRCPVAAECWSERARARAREADIVITNHALLAIDAMENRQTLPPHDVVVVDEGHDLVDRVTTSLSTELTAAGVHAAAAAARRAGADVADLDAAAERLERELQELPAVRLRGPLPSGLEDTLVLLATAGRTALRSMPKEPGPDAAGRLQVARAGLMEVTGVSERLTGAAAGGRPTGGRDASADEDGDVGAGDGGGDDDEAAAQPADAPAGADVVWLEHDERRGAVLHAAPLSVAGMLRTRLFDDRTVVATSATLTGPGGFEDLARRLGLGRSGWRGLDVGSPFDYARQGILYIARHLPPPGRDGHGDPLHAELVDLVTAAGGRTLGLFSSRRAAEAAAEAVRARTDLPVLCQGDDVVATLVRQFAADPAACLFGTLGLWQGVDVPGPSCSLVVLDRIPFPRPDEPLAQARSEAVDASGGSGFMAVSVAHAATLLAQGAGRLIRTGSDRGVVAVLDSRLATRRYGAALVDGLPPMWRTTDREVALGALRRLAQVPVPPAARGPLSDRPDPALQPS